MERQPVKSSLLKAVGFDHATKTLEIEFSHHKADAPPKVYTYTPFTEERAAEFLAAESLGKYFLKNIKTDATLTCKKVEEPREEEVEANQEKE